MNPLQYTLCGVLLYGILLLSYLLYLDIKEGKKDKAAEEKS